jgi:hypothetical protein
VVVNQEGQHLSDHFFHTSPNPYVFRAAWATQIPNNKIIAAGNQSVGTNSLVSFIGKYDSNKVKEWGSYKSVGGLMPWPSLDGGYSRLEGIIGDSNYLRRYNSDSSLNWSITIGPNSKADFYDMVYDGFNNAYLAGYKKGVQNIENAYIIKVANIGIPFDPTENKEIYESEPFKSLMAFPNPCNDNLYFKNVFYTSRVEVYDVLGRKKAEFKINPGEGVSLLDLPKGHYLVRVEAKGKTRSVRILKE